MPDPRSTPEKIGRYPVLRLIGRGAMGAVFLARDSDLGRDVAIKTVRLPPQPKDQETFLDRFRNEARAVGRLKHPGIVQVFDVGNDPEAGPYLVFEYVEGANLKEHLQSHGPLGPVQVVTLAEQVGSALDAAHREGIIHRDIKPENLLMDRDGNTHLADFGVARVPDAQLTTEGQFLGTPCYGAPETLMGREATRASDQFSFGAVLYEVVSGVRAFPGKEAVVVAHAVIHESPRPPSRVAQQGAEVPHEVDAVIGRAMNKDPAQRYGTLSALVLALRMAYADAGLLPRPDQALNRDGAFAGRRSSSSPAPLGSKRLGRLPLWPFGAALLLGGVAVVQVGGFAGDVFGATPPASDGGVLPLGAVLPLDTLPEAAIVDALLAEPDAGLIDDAGAALLDAGADGSAALEAAADDPLAHLAPFEREERAKDALERAQRALTAGDREGAKAAIEEAFRLDPEHPEVIELRRKL